MMQKIITKEELFKQLDSLAKDFEIIGPKESANKGIFYETVAQADQIYLGEGFTTEPVKKFFLSPSEWIFKSQNREGKDALEEISLPQKKRIIIGVRPCEARGLTLLDKIFISDCRDNFYGHNRERTIMIGLACSKPDRTCFCTSMGGEPVSSRGLDVLLFDAGEQFIAEIITEEAQKLFGSLGKNLTEPQRASWQLNKEKGKDLVKTKVNVKTPEELDTIFESDYWQEVSLSCVSCGICTYLCPTCHCFDLVDEERKRLRCYDGCAFPDFTVEASGENPRPTKRERYRQRVFHKFGYFKKNFGENLCVGCGRCIRYCPVKIDISEIVDKAPIKK